MSEKDLTPSHKSGSAMAYTRGWDDQELWEGLFVVVTEDSVKYEKECRASKLSWPNARDGKPRTAKMGRYGNIEKVDPRDKTAHLSNDLKWVPIRTLVGFENWDEDVVGPALARSAREAAEAKRGPVLPKTAPALVAETKATIRYLPKAVNGKTVLIHVGGDSFRVDNSALKSETISLGYRRSKDLKDFEQTIRGPLWDSIIEGKDDGDGWIETDIHTNQLNSELKDRNKQVTEMRKTQESEEADLSARDRRIAELQRERDRRIAELKEEREKRIAEVQQGKLANDASASAMSSRIAELEVLCREKEHEIHELRLHQAQHLRVTIVGCTGLRSADWTPILGGKSDPFCICKVSDKHKSERSEFRTQTIDDSLNPLWNHAGTIADYRSGDSLHFAVKDEDIVGEDHLGDSKLEISTILREGGFDGHLTLAHAGYDYRPLLHVKVEVVGTVLPDEAERYEELEARLSERNIRVAELQRELEAILAERAAQRGERDRELEESRGERDRRIDDLEKDYARRIENLEASLQERDSRIAAMQTSDSKRIQSLEASLKERDSFIEEMQQSDSKRIQDRDADLQERDSRIEAMQKADLKRIQILEEALKERDSRIEAMQKADSKRIQSLEADLKERDSRIEEMQRSDSRRIQMLEEGLKERDSRIGAMQKADSKRIRGLEEGLTERDSRIEAMEKAESKRIHSLEASLKERDRRIEHLTSENTEIAELQRHQAQHLRVTIVGCKGLRNADWMPIVGGKSDPFCICKVSNAKKSARTEFRTKTINDNLNPVWNHTAALHDYRPGDTLQFIVKDEDLVGEDHLGDVKLEISKILKNDGFEGDLTLARAGYGYKPSLHVKVEVVGSVVPSERLEEIEAMMKERERRIAELQADRHERDTRIAEIEAERHERDRRIAELEAERERRIAQAEAERHERNTRIAELEAERHERDRRISELQQINFADEANGKVLQARIAEMEAVCKERSTEIKQLEAHQAQYLSVTIVGCTGLRDADWVPIFGGKSDPYCICRVAHKRKSERSEFYTRTISDSLNPVWNHQATLSDFNPADHLEFIVKDEDLVGSDHLGDATLDISKILRDGRFDGKLQLSDAGKGFKPLLHVKIQVHGDGGTLEAAYAKIADLQAKRRALIERAEASELKIQELMSSEKELRSALSQRDALVAELQGERKVLIERAEARELKIQELLSSEKELRSALSQRDALVAELQGERKVLIERAEARELKIQELLSSEKELRSALSQRDALVAELQGERKIQEIKIQELLSSEKELRSALSQRDALVAELQGERKILLERAEAIEASLQLSYAERDKAIGELHRAEKICLERVAAADAKVEEYSGFCSARDHTIAELHGERRAIMESVQELRREKEALLARAEAIEIKAAELQTLLSERDRTISELQKMYQASMERVDNADAKVEELQGGISQRDLAIAELQGTNRTLSIRTEGAEAAMRQQQDFFQDQLWKQRDGSEKKLEDMRAQVMQLEEASRATGASIDSLAVRDEQLRLSVESWHSSHYTNRRLVGVQQLRRSLSPMSAPASHCGYPAGRGVSPFIGYQVYQGTVPSPKAKAPGPPLLVAMPFTQTQTALATQDINRSAGSIRSGGDLFDALDLNHDGYISREELSKGIAVGLAEPQAQPSPPYQTARIATTPMMPPTLPSPRRSLGTGRPSSDDTL